MKNFIYILLFISSFPLIGQTKYYLSNDGDNSDGLSDATAWTSLDSINNNTFSAGDTIALKRGSVWRGTIVVPSSGSAGSYLVFTQYGTGNNPVILGSEKSLDFTNRTGNIWGSSTDLVDPYLGIIDADITFFDGTIETRGDYQTYTTSFSNLVNEFDFTWSGDSIYVYSETDPDAAYDSIEVPQRNNVFELSDKQYIEINGIDMYCFKSSGITDNGSDDDYTGLVVRNCTIAHSGTEDGYGYGVNAVYSHTLIEYNTIYDMGRRGVSYYNYGNYDIDSCVIQYNTFYYGLHTTGPDIAAGSTTGDAGDLYNITVRYNLIYEDTTVAGSQAAQMSFIGAQEATGYIDTVKVYNNVFKHVNGTGIYYETNIENFELYNNTFYGYNKIATTTLSHINLNSISALNVTLKNNIFYNNAAKATASYSPCVFLSGGTDYTDITSDYNLFYAEDLQSYIWERLGGTPGSLLYTMSDWETYKTTTSLDVNSPDAADPLFTSSTDLTLQSSSPAIGAGTPISWITTDYAGNARDATTPDIGAYEYQPSNTSGVVVKSLSTSNPIIINGKIINL